MPVATGQELPNTWLGSPQPHSPINLEENIKNLGWIDAACQYKIAIRVFRLGTAVNGELLRFAALLI